MFSKKQSGRHWAIRLLFVLGLYTMPVNGQVQLPNTLSAADKVFGLSTFWQEVNYNFVYLNKVNRREWDSTYKVLITRVQQTTNDYEYYRLLQKFCALLKDGHTNVYFPGEINSKLLTRMFGPYWFGLSLIDGKPVVTQTLQTKIKEIPIGSEIISVNDIPAAQYLRDSVEPYISSSTEYVRRSQAVTNMLQGLTGTSYKVTMKRPDGSLATFQLQHERTTDTSFYPPLKQRDLFELKWYKNDIACIALNSFGDQKIDSLFKAALPELYKAKALIVDLRYNGGGSTNIGTEILQYLMKDSLMQHSRYYTRNHLAAFKAWGKFIKPADTLYSDWNKKAWHVYHDDYYYAFDYEPDTIQLSAKRIVVPTAVLISNNTASAAEDFLISADNQPHFKKIGEPSFGSTGQPFLFDLPGGGSARVCTKKDTYPDGREFVGYGVQPDIKVAPGLQDFLRDNDVVLNTALKYLEEELRKKAGGQ
ncbi:MAG: S41 family peptidase [Chitinophagaceae bacterium]